MNKGFVSKLGIGSLRDVSRLLLLCVLCLIPTLRLQAEQGCLECHGDNTLTGRDSTGAEISMYVPADTFKISSHGALSCTDCHADLVGVKDFPHAEKLKPVDCSACHDDIAKTFMSSAHGQALANPNAPTCSACHGKHDIFPHSNPLALTSAKKLPYTCASCHHKIALKEDPDIRITDSFDRYMKGIHAEGIARGVGSAASCNDCHGTHDLRKASDPISMVNKMNIPRTCSKCHNDISIQYNKGIHGKALNAGILDAPNCTDCHGEHEILKIDNPNSPVNSSNLADYVCGKCHNDRKLVEKYGLPEGRFTSYQDSYHGLAVKGGSLKAANCISCHKAHDVLPSGNPASSINKDNITQTCQKCHPRANYAFATSYTHRTATVQFNVLDKWVRVIYIIAIVVIIGSMVGHNGVILASYIVEKHRRNKTLPTVVRFTGNMIFQHLVLTVAFITLVITGFALKFTDAWWANILSFFGIHEEVRSVIHRIAAVFLIYITIHHALFILFAKRGREELKGLMPNMQDLKDIAQNIRYYLGSSKEHPRFDMYDYTEKAEYWALVWGTIAMMVTGFVLWFPTFFTSFMPAWIVKIAETIHYYEAWLATLAIAIFHFFFVIFHPEQYPMSFAWLTGKITEESCKTHHPRWYERITGKKIESEGEGGHTK